MVCIYTGSGNMYAAAYAGAALSTNGLDAELRGGISQVLLMQELAGML